MMNANPTAAQPLDLDKLEALARAATPGPWDFDTTQNDGLYGGGEDPGCGFDSYSIHDAHGRMLLDSVNSDAASIEEDIGDEDMRAWDETARRNVEFIVAARAALPALIAQARAQQAGAAPSEMMRAALLNIRDYRTDVADDVAAPSMRFYAQMALEQIDATPPAPMCHAPECGMCKDSGIVGFPPDQYEGCPDCIKARSIAPSDATGKDDAANAGELSFRERFADAYLSLSVAHFSSPFWNQSMEQLLVAVDAEINKRVAERGQSPATSAADAKGKADAANAGDLPARWQDRSWAHANPDELDPEDHTNQLLAEIADWRAWGTKIIATSAADAKDAEPTDAMIEAYLAFTARASHLSHPDVPYAGTINGDSEEKWRRRFAAAAIRAAIAATQQAAPVPSAPACPWCEKHALIPGHREDSAQIFQCAACLNLSHLSPVDQQAQSSAKGGDAAGEGVQSYE